MSPFSAFLPVTQENEGFTFGSKKGLTHELGKKPLFCVGISFPCRTKVRFIIICAALPTPRPPFIRGLQKHRKVQYWKRHWGEKKQQNPWKMNGLTKAGLTAGGKTQLLHHLWMKSWGNYFFFRVALVQKCLSAAAKSGEMSLLVRPAWLSAGARAFVQHSNDRF